MPMNLAEISINLKIFEVFFRKKIKLLYIVTYLKLENHLTNCAVLFLLNLMSGKYIFKMAEDGYRTQKNINLAFLKCIGVKVELVASPPIPEKPD